MPTRAPKLILSPSNEIKRVLHQEWQGDCALPQMVHKSKGILPCPKCFPKSKGIVSCPKEIPISKEDESVRPVDELRYKKTNAVFVCPSASEIFKD